MRKLGKKEGDMLKRIMVDPKIFGGKPIVRGHRLSVEDVLAMLEKGNSVEELLQGYPFLEREDILACISYARKTMSHEVIEPLEVLSS